MCLSVIEFVSPVLALTAAARAMAPIDEAVSLGISSLLLHTVSSTPSCAAAQCHYAVPYRSLVCALVMCLQRESSAVGADSVDGRGFGESGLQDQRMQGKQPPVTSHVVPIMLGWGWSRSSS